MTFTFLTMANTTYFDAAAFRFLRDLAKNNNREWFNARQGAVRANGARSLPAPDRRPRRAAGEDQPALPRRSAPERRLDVPHLPRYALRQRQDAVQDVARRTPVPRTQPPGACAAVLRAHCAGRMLRRRRPVASGVASAQAHSRLSRRQSGDMEESRAARSDSASGSNWAASRSAGRRAVSTPATN